VALDLPGNTFLLRLEVAGDMMALWVNDELVIENVPLSRSDGWIGLISFGGPVTYDGLKVLIGE
jgi:hypothetical protein